MFISKKDLRDLKSKAGAASALQSQLDKLKKELKDFNDDLSVRPAKPKSLMETIWGYSRYETIGETIYSLEQSIREQRNLTRMILAHLGVEYAKLTEETKTGKQEKEVLRRAKKQNSENPRH